MCIKKIEYEEPIKPIDAANNIINFYKKAKQEILLKSIIYAEYLIDDEELKKEYFYIRKLKIVSAFLHNLPILFNNDNKKMKKFLEKNRIPSRVYENILTNLVITIQTNNDFNDINDINDIYESDTLNTIKNYICDIILI
jgi:hypothetical protein